jgi:cyanophycin synthetase
MNAFRVAAEISDDVLVERYLPGHDYRLLVIGDKLIAAARRDPPLVVGDGKRTIRELVDHVNSDPRRGDRPCHLPDQDPLRRDRPGHPDQAGL